jgi:electron transport complex protein RnfC
LFKNVASQLLGFRRPRLPLEVDALPIVDFDVPAVLRFSVGQKGDAGLCVSVKAGDSIEPGGLLASHTEGALVRSPVRGSVSSVTTEPEIRGGQQGTAVLVQPAADSPEATLPKLDPEHASVKDLVGRLREAGVVSNSLFPVSLAEDLCLVEGNRIDQLIVLAADREPGVCASLQLFRDRVSDLEAAVKLLGRVSNASRIVLAVLEDLAEEATGACSPGSMEILPLPAEYPETLEPMVALRAGAKGVTRFVTLETALAALDAVRDGVVQRTKVVTVIGFEGKPVANYRVPIGTRIQDVLEAVGIEPGERDKVLAGGPMRGFAQVSTSGAIDAGVDAITVVAAKDVVPWSDEPCINCGHCIDICPAHLQVQLIGRYAEFELFDRTPALDIDQCIECGLCASVCTGRRPLLQLIRLAKREVEAV